MRYRMLVVLAIVGLILLAVASTGLVTSSPAPSQVSAVLTRTSG
jgi:hypothetical protein